VSKKTSTDTRKVTVALSLETWKALKHISVDKEQPIAEVILDILDRSVKSASKRKVMNVINQEDGA
jgi:macrodomain Ter protein organizer (MatP/YcbG family)